MESCPSGELSWWGVVIEGSCSGPRCIKLTINGKLDFNGNYHRILDTDWFLVSCCHGSHH